MRSALFWTLFPLLIPQALATRRRTPRFAPPPGATEGRIGQGAPLRLHGIGDSIIAGVGTSSMERCLTAQLAQQLSRGLGRAVDWRAQGLSGASTASIRKLLVPSLPEQPIDLFLVSTGVNDVTGLTRSGRFRDELVALLEALGQHSPEAVILLPGLPPLHRFPALRRPLRDLLAMRGRQLDDIAAEVAATAAGQRVVHVRLAFQPEPSAFAADGFHPADAACGEIARLLAHGIERRLASTSRSARL